MLPKKERLSRKEFNRFFSIGKRFHFPTFQVVYAPYTTLHVSVVVSKKIAKTAVHRNKVRRRIYDIVRNYRTENSLTGVFIFFTKQPVTLLTYAKLQEEVRMSVQNILKRSA
jgi:ribonuclease P protein component